MVIKQNYKNIYCMKLTGKTESIHFNLSLINTDDIHIEENILQNNRM